MRSMAQESPSLKKTQSAISLYEHIFFMKWIPILWNHGESQTKNSG